jgi:hypothetical protein
VAKEQRSKGAIELRSNGTKMKRKKGAKEQLCKKKETK